MAVHSDLGFSYRISLGGGGGEAAGIPEDVDNDAYDGIVFRTYCFYRCWFFLSIPNRDPPGERKWLVKFGKHSFEKKKHKNGNLFTILQSSSPSPSLFPPLLGGELLP